MTHPPQDTMAGATARRISEHPNEAQPILDPTDPRVGQTMPQSSDHRPILDPTDPRSGQGA
jgi:hypothetical protein